MNQQGLQALKTERDLLKATICCGSKEGDFPFNHSPEEIESNRGELIEEAIRASRLSMIDQMIAHTTIAPVPRQCTKVAFGHRVEAVYLDPHDHLGELIVVIGGEDEPSAFENLQTISCMSPCGKALIGKEVGDDAEFLLPSGERRSVEVRKIDLPPGQQKLELVAA
jgi:transcription elongation GreA/GreB family factor